jgi:hypothetical protein
MVGSLEEAGDSTVMALSSRAFSLLKDTFSASTALFVYMKNNIYFIMYEKKNY